MKQSQKHQKEATDSSNASKNKKIESCSNSDFVLTDIFSEHFSENLKHFDIPLNLIIESLKPKLNIKQCSIFEEKIFHNSQYNYFWTWDLLLSFEIYDDSQISLQEIKNFAVKYKKHISDKADRLRCTNLPLIIGLYQITVMGKTKFLLLNRHSFSFSQFHPFKHWYLLSFD